MFKIFTSFIDMVHNIIQIIIFLDNSRIESECGIFKKYSMEP